MGGEPLRVAWNPRGGPLGQEAGEPGKRPLPGDPQSWPSNSPTPRPMLQCLICKKRADNSHLANLQAGLWEPRQSRLCHNIKLVTNAHLDGALSLMADAVLSPRPVSRQPLPRKLPSADESPGLGIYTIPRRTPDGAAWTGERLPLPQGGAALWFMPLNRSWTGPGQTPPESTSSFGHFFPQVLPQSSPSVHYVHQTPASGSASGEPDLSLLHSLQAVVSRGRARSWTAGTSATLSSWAWHMAGRTPLAWAAEVNEDPP